MFEKSTRRSMGGHEPRFYTVTTDRQRTSAGRGGGHVVRTGLTMFADSQFRGIGCRSNASSAERFPSVSSPTRERSWPAGTTRSVYRLGAALGARTHPARRNSKSDTREGKERQREVFRLISEPEQEELQKEAFTSFEEGYYAAETGVANAVGFVWIGLRRSRGGSRARRGRPSRARQGSDRESHGTCSPPRDASAFRQPPTRAGAPASIERRRVTRKRSHRTIQTRDQPRTAR